MTERLLANVCNGVNSDKTRSEQKESALLPTAARKRTWREVRDGVIRVGFVVSELSVLSLQQRRYSGYRGTSPSGQSRTSLLVRPIGRKHGELSQRDLVSPLELKGRHHVQSSLDHCWCVARTQRLTR